MAEVFCVALVSVVRMSGFQRLGFLVEPSVIVLVVLLSHGRFSDCTPYEDPLSLSFLKLGHLKIIKKSFAYSSSQKSLSHTSLQN